MTMLVVLVDFCHTRTISGAFIRAPEVDQRDGVAW
jgi:hypothetical protein